MSFSPTAADAYPEPAYLGEHGEPTHVLRRASAGPDLTHSNGGGAHYVATGAQTGGHFGLYRWDMGPVPSGPPPHFHRSITESFFVLSGTVRLYAGTGWVDATEGDFLFVPEGGVHGFRNDSGAAASMLILFTPGAPREDYFETLADEARRATLQDPDVAAAFYLRHDTVWV